MGSLHLDVFQSRLVELDVVKSEHLCMNRAIGFGPSMCGDGSGGSFRRIILHSTVNPVP